MSYQQKYKSKYLNLLKTNELSIQKGGNPSFVKFTSYTNQIDNTTTVELKKLFIDDLSYYAYNRNYEDLKKINEIAQVTNTGKKPVKGKAEVMDEGAIIKQDAYIKVSEIQKFIRNSLPPARKGEVGSLNIMQIVNNDFIKDAASIEFIRITQFREEICDLTYNKKDREELKKERERAKRDKKAIREPKDVISSIKTYGHITVRAGRHSNASMKTATIMVANKEPCVELKVLKSEAVIRYNLKDYVPSYYSFSQEKLFML
jgi:hypothetical protein